MLGRALVDADADEVGGSRSGVNWTRFHEQSIDAASALARLVLPTPGHVLDEQVALGEEAHHGQLDRLDLAVHDLGRCWR